MLRHLHLKCFHYEFFPAVLAWLMNKSPAVAFASFNSLLCAPSSPAPWCSSLPVSAACWLGRQQNQSAPALRAEGLQAKLSSSSHLKKGRGGVLRGECSGTPPRLTLLQHCRTHFFYFNKVEESLSFCSLSCLLSTTSNQMGSRDKTMKTQCLYLAWCQACLPSKYWAKKCEETVSYYKSSRDVFLWTQCVCESLRVPISNLKNYQDKCHIHSLCHIWSSYVGSVHPPSSYLCQTTFIASSATGAWKMSLCAWELPELWCRIMAQHFSSSLIWTWSVQVNPAAGRKERSLLSRKCHRISMGFSALMYIYCG